MNRRNLKMLAGLAVLALPGLMTAAPRAHAARDQVAVTIDSTFYSHTLKIVAVLDMLTPTIEDERVYKVQDMVEAAISEKGDFTVMYSNDLKAAAESGGAREAYETLTRVWQQRRVVDRPALEKVAQAVGLDALLGIEVTHWEQFQLDLSSEGNSTTTVGLKVSMYATHDAGILWQAAEVYVAKSPPYNPSNSSVADAGGEARAAGGAGAPRPPEYVPTAKRVVKDVFGTWPKVKKTDGKKDDKKGDK